MRIRTFCKFLEVEELQKHTLKDCTVVVDGQNFFYKLYQQSRLPSMYGCEGDKYANYLRKFLEMFKKANIRCYFIFKGGHEDINFKFKRLDERQFLIKESPEHYFVNPVFMKELYKQVLDEMGFHYAICEYESKAEIIAFANKYKCPVISFDIEFSFSGVPYIPFTSISDNNKDGLECSMFDLRNFLMKRKLTENKLSIFIALTDENIFEEDFFLPLFAALKMPRSPYKRNKGLLMWLAQTPDQRALDVIYKYVSKSEFDGKLQEASKFVYRKNETGIPSEYMESKENIEVTELDPQWFEKGVTMGHIGIYYVNLYRNNIYFSAWTIEDDNAEDSMVFSLDIIKYAYNLLNNFEKKEFIFQNKRNNKLTISATNSVKKPRYDAISCPFENGWDRIKNLRLFEHFLDQTLQNFNHAALQQAPEEVRLLLIALVYFSRLKTIDTTNIVCSVLLSYIMLGVVSEKTTENITCDVEVKRKPYLDPITEKDAVNERDCVIANNLLHTYFCLTVSESNRIFKGKLIHPFVEFQHCLVQLNNLNNLCGYSYKPTEYSKTFNGTFIYKFLVDAESQKSGNGLDFVRQLLNPAATVLSYFNGIFDLYQELMYH